MSNDDYARSLAQGFEGRLRWEEIIAEQGFAVMKIGRGFEAIEVLVCNECGALVPVEVPPGFARRPIEIHVQHHAGE